MLDVHLLCPVNKPGNIRIYLGNNILFLNFLLRRKNVRRKLNAMALEFHGKNVLLVDGKITSKQNKKSPI